MTIAGNKKDEMDVQVNSFRAVVSKVADYEYIAEITSIPHCMASGETIDEAVTNIQEVLDAMLEIMIEDGEPIPDDSNEIKNPAIL